MIVFSRPILSATADMDLGGGGGGGFSTMGGGSIRLGESDESDRDEGDLENQSSSSNRKRRCSGSPLRCLASNNPIVGAAASTYRATAVTAGRVSNSAQSRLRSTLNSAQSRFGQNNRNNNNEQDSDEEIGMGSIGASVSEVSTKAEFDTLMEENDNNLYCKGGSVVKMCRAVLGMKAFQKGLGAYMKKHAYGNTETDDLWRAWEESSGMPVQEMMASWTEQMGFPLVTVTGEEWEDDKVTLQLEQEWFLSDGSPLSDEEKQKKWCIPLLTCTEEGTQQDMIFMREKTATVTVPLKSGKWVKLNAGQDVPMRVKLTPTMIERLGVGIKSKTLPPADRAALLTDSYALVKANKMEPENLIKLLSNYTDEDDYIVWSGIADILGGLDSITSDDEAMSKNFKHFGSKIVLGLYKKVGWESKPTDGHLDVLLRGMMIGLLSTFCYADSSVSAEATRRFELFKQNHGDMEALPSDMRSSVFKIVLKNGGSKEYDEVKAYFSQASDNAERKHVLGSIGHATDPQLKKSTLEWAISGEIKLQDFFYPMGSVRSSSGEGRPIAFTFMKENFQAIKDMVGTASSSLMDAVIVSCAGGFTSNEKADEIEEFFKANPVPKSSRKIQQTVENMRANAKFFSLLQSSELGQDSFWSSL